MKKIIISSKSFDEDYSKLLEKGYNVIQKSLSEEVIDRDVVGIIAGTEKITAKIMERTPNLKVISRYGVGTDNIDLEYTKKHNIEIYTTDTHVDAVAEHTITLILAHLKNLTNNSKTKNNLLKGKTVGIIGYGKVGQRLYELLKPFRVKILRYDIKESTHHHYVRLEEILKKSDIITLHCPLTKETINMIDYEDFFLMKDKVILINTARAKIINESALLDFAKDSDHKIALDDVPHSNLFTDYKNVIITRHEASYTYETRKEMAEQAIDNLLDGMR